LSFGEILNSSESKMSYHALTQIKKEISRYRFPQYVRIWGTFLFPVFLAANLYAQTSVVAPGAEVKLLASGFEFTEGPASDKDGNVYFTDQPNDRILVWGINGKLSTFMQGSGRSNGLSFDRQGNLWACADEKNELWRISPTGEHTVIIKEYNGKLLNGPNDVWIRPDGGLYFTDPFFRRDYWTHQNSEQDAQGVYYLDAQQNKLIRVADDLMMPNGIIGTPDGKILYVADLGEQKTYRYNIQPDGTLSDKKLFCEMGSDGMTIDSEGNVYLTGRGVTVFDPSGKQIHQISVNAPWTANVCFGGKDRKTLFITAMQNLFGMQMRVKGVGSQ
jgi:gluconolactonase